MHVYFSNGKVMVFVQTVDIKVKMDCDGCERRVRNVVRRMKGSFSPSLISLSLTLNQNFLQSLFFSLFVSIFSIILHAFSLLNILIPLLKLQFYSWPEYIITITNHLLNPLIGKTVPNFQSENIMGQMVPNLSLFTYVKRVP